MWISLRSTLFLYTYRIYISELVRLRRKNWYSQKKSSKRVRTLTLNTVQPSSSASERAVHYQVKWTFPAFFCFLRVSLMRTWILICFVHLRFCSVCTLHNFCDARVSGCRQQQRRSTKCCQVGWERRREMTSWRRDWIEFEKNVRFNWTRMLSSARCFFACFCFCHTQFTPNFHSPEIASLRHNCPKKTVFFSSRRENLLCLLLSFLFYRGIFIILFLEFDIFEFFFSSSVVRFLLPKEKRRRRKSPNHTSSLYHPTVVVIISIFQESLLGFGVDICFFFRYFGGCLEVRARSLPRAVCVQKTHKTQQNKKKN